jgi:hypothetical protein
VVGLKDVHGLSAFADNILAADVLVLLYELGGTMRLKTKLRTITLMITTFAMRQSY